MRELEAHDHGPRLLTVHLEILESSGKIYLHEKTERSPPIILCKRVATEPINVYHVQYITIKWLSRLKTAEGWKPLGTDSESHYSYREKTLLRVNQLTEDAVFSLHVL